MGGKVTYPLEGDRFEETRFYVYDGIGRKVWGTIRVRREKNPDVLVFEARQDRGLSKHNVKEGDGPWKLLFKCTAHDGRLMAATFGIQGGANPPEGSASGSPNTIITP